MAPNGGIHSVDSERNRAHHVMFQPQEVLTQHERDVHLDSPV